MVLVAACIVAPLTYLEYSTGYHQNNPHSLVDYMFQEKEIGLTNTLLLFFIYKFLVTAISVTLPLPVGLFMSVFLTGGVLGRVVGEFLISFEAESMLSSFEVFKSKI